MATVWNKTQDWFWEGNIQDVIVKHLEGKGFRILSAADTDKKEQGPDIKAGISGSILQVAVKGYPSDKYVSGTKLGLKKRTHPATQARHWLGEALLEVMIAKSKDNAIGIALGVPEYSTYSTLLRNLQWLRQATQLNCYVVRSDGSVRLLKPTDAI